MSALVVGAGAFGTAMAAGFAQAGRKVDLLVRKPEVADDINIRRMNSEYLPGVSLSERISAVCEPRRSSAYSAVFLAVPSHSLLTVAAALAEDIEPGVPFFNLAKGFHQEYLTFDEALKTVLPQHPVGALKGPSFARPLAQGAPTGLTVACSDPRGCQRLLEYCAHGKIHLEVWDKLGEVEFVSGLKNVYAIVMGLCDALDDNPNSRFMMLKKIIEEARQVLIDFNYSPDVLYTYAGLGDMLMTALNDSSRNRTLGLLMGRGFSFSGEVKGPLTEGRKSVNLLKRHALGMGKNYDLIFGLAEVFSEELTPLQFYGRFLKK